eukprot:3136853-Rhodomonas_salina.1
MCWRACCTLCGADAAVRAASPRPRTAPVTQLRAHTLSCRPFQFRGARECGLGGGRSAGPAGDSAESLAAAAHIRRSKPRRPELSSPVRAYAYLDLNASTDDRRMPVYLGTDMGDRVSQPPDVLVGGVFAPVGSGSDLRYQPPDPAGACGEIKCKQPMMQVLLPEPSLDEGGLPGGKRTGGVKGGTLQRHYAERGSDIWVLALRRCRRS